MNAETRVVSATREMHANPETIFELIADPSRQPEWDGNDNLSGADAGQRVRAVGDVFVMTNVGEKVRENRVVEFEEGRRIAWQPAPVGEPAPGHLWRWEISPLADGGSLVRHTYDWSGLTDERRFDRARQFDSAALRSSLERLAALAESLSA